MSVNKIFNQPLNVWMLGGGGQADVVLSSRIRLARNLDGIPFPNRASQAQLAKVVQSVKDVIPDLSAATGQNYLFFAMDELLPLERNVLVEKHIVSPNHVQQPAQRALIVEEDATVSIMINEEDHLRIQCMMPGLDLNKAFQLADTIDDSLEARYDFGFNEQMGYLTSCPTNLGTGLRASVMLHLPVLVFTRQMNRIIHAATQLGLAVRGLYGEGTEAAGNVFQISNQLTLGYSEQEIIGNLHSIVQQVVEHERNARQALAAQSKGALADRVWRSYGILRYAHSISGQEALTLLSEVRLGIDLGIIDVAEAALFNELLVTTRPNFLQKVAGEQELDSSERDILRAQIIRNRLKEVNHDVR